LDFALGLGAAGCLRLAPASAVPELSSVFWPLPCPEPFDGWDVACWMVVVCVAAEPCEGFGFGLVVGEAEVEVEVDVDVEEVELVVCGCVVVTVAAGVVAVTGGHDWLTFVIGRLTGRGSDVGGVPGGTFWKVNCCPPATVIVTVQPSADALGSAAKPSTVTMDPMVTAAIVSLRLFNTVAYSSRKVPRAMSSQLRSQIGLVRKLLSGAELCNWEPSVFWVSGRVPTAWRRHALTSGIPLNRQEPAATVALWTLRRTHLILNPRVRYAGYDQSDGPGLNGLATRAA
jgi:hypothetical protein